MPWFCHLAQHKEPSLRMWNRVRSTSIMKTEEITRPCLRGTEGLGEWPTAVAPHHSELKCGVPMGTLAQLSQEMHRKPLAEMHRKVQFTLGLIFTRFIAGLCIKLRTLHTVCLLSPGISLIHSKYVGYHVTSLKEGYILLHIQKRTIMYLQSLRFLILRNSVIGQKVIY